jgi:hypothetical protein
MLAHNWELRGYGTTKAEAIADVKGSIMIPVTGICVERY